MWCIIGCCRSVFICFMAFGCTKTLDLMALSALFHCIHVFGFALKVYFVYWNYSPHYLHPPISAEGELLERLWIHYKFLELKALKYITNKKLGAGSQFVEREN